MCKTLYLTILLVLAISSGYCQSLTVSDFIRILNLSTDQRALYLTNEKHFVASGVHSIGGSTYSKDTKKGRETVQIITLSAPSSSFVISQLASVPYLDDLKVQLEQLGFKLTLTKSSAQVDSWAYSNDQYVVNLLKARGNTSSVSFTIHRKH